MVYHSIASLSSFQTDLDWYQEWNYTTIDVDDLYTYLSGGDSLPDKPLLLTFDDGLNSQFTIAYPELVARGMKATFYVIPNWMDDLIDGTSFGALEPTHFSWANAVSMKASGMRIQSHTPSHVSMLTKTDDENVADFFAAKSRIEEMVPGETVNHIAYPYGVCPDSSQVALEDAGVHTGRTVTNVFTAPSSGKHQFVDPYMMPLAVPCAGETALDVRQANTHGKLTLERQIVPDFAFKSGGPKGWTIATGASLDGSVLRPNAPTGSYSLKQVQQTGSVSSVTTRAVPISVDARLRGTVWIKTSGLGATGRAFIYLLYIRPDGITTYRTTQFLTTIPDNQDWTQYTFDYFGDTNVGFVKLGLQVAGTASPTGTAWFGEPSLGEHVVGPPNLHSLST